MENTFSNHVRKEHIIHSVGKETDLQNIAEPKAKANSLSHFQTFQGNDGI
jgi:hypothetical protein